MQSAKIAPLKDKKVKKKENKQSEETKDQKKENEMNGNQNIEEEEDDFSSLDGFDDDDDQEEKDQIEIWRVATRKFLATTTAGYIYENLLLVLSVLSALEFIYQTYLDVDSDADLIHFFDLVEQVLAVLFMLDWLLNCFLSEHRILYITSFYSMIDILTVIPIWVSVYSFVPFYHEIYTFRDGVVYFMVSLSTSRILRALRIRKKLMAIEDEVKRCVGDIALTLVVMILFFSALMQFLEKEVQLLDFHTCMYFMAVTITTVGYGDISPLSLLGRIAVMAMIFTGVALIPQMTNELVETAARMSVYARAIFHPKGKASTHSHVVICGELGALSLSEFFDELFHEDHENLNLHAVVLCPNEPSAEMGFLLRDPVYSMNITYLEGSALNQNDLRRASVQFATSVFIMTDKFSTNPDEEDAKTILQQFSIKQFLSSHSSELLQQKPPLLCIQVIRPENRRHLMQSKNEDDDREDLVMCLNELKMGVIAKAVMFPGTNTLLMNLLTSFADDDDDDDDDGGEEGDSAEIDNLNSDDTDHWLMEYQRGCDWEIYTTELSANFEGATFVKLSEMLYQRLGIVLFALQVEDLQKDKSNIRTLLNPADFVIPPKHEYKIDAFVIAKNANQSDLTFSGGHEGEADRNETSVGSPVAKKKDDGKLSVDDDDVQVKVTAKYDWQKLLRKYEKTHFSTSEQEFTQKIEEGYLHENFFTLEKRANIDENTVISSLKEEFPNVSNHTIIVGKSLASIYDLIKNLRAKYLEILRHIVILTPFEFPHHVWARISIFKGILVMRGSSLEEADILRAGVFKAAQVIVLADASASGKHTHKSGGIALIDADAIFSYQCVRRMNDNCSCVVEIVRSENVGYLDPEGVLASGGKVNYNFTPQFASGALFTTSLLDTLVCQAFYNNKIIKVLSEMFSGVDRKSRAVIESELRGDQASAKEMKKGVASITGSTLYQIPVPELQNRTYGSLFKHLSVEGIIPLGLYRGVFPYMQIGPKQNKACYVYTNPAKDTELFSVDKVYVLSPRQLIASSKKRLKMAEQAMVREKLSGDATNFHVQEHMTKVEEVLFDRMSLFENGLKESFNRKLNDLATTSVIMDDGSVM
jgi:hypothetical protein